MASENRLLIIAMNELQGCRYDRLENAKGDAERFANVLEDKYQFIPYPAIFDNEATRRNIIKALHKLRAEISPDDNLIIFYAGHGEQDPVSKLGFWVPYDGRDDASEYVNHSTVIDIIKGITAKHILLISDSCYSGTFISRIRQFGKRLTDEELDSKNSRWVFVSGGEEPVLDGSAGKGSPFSRSLSEFLEKNVKPVVSAGELFDAVIRATEEIAIQMPAAAPIICDAHHGGEMIFRLKSVITQEEIIVSESLIIPETSKFIPFIPRPVEYYITRTVSVYEHQRDEISYFFQPEKGRAYLADLVNSQNRIVLLGTAGSGKSIELGKLAQSFAEKAFSEFTPVYKKFNLYTDQTIETYLPEDWQTIEPGKAVIMLDGLDEVQSRYMPTALRQIAAFSEKFKDLKIIISCRSNFYEFPSSNFTGTLDGFRVLLLNDITLFEVKNYADRAGVNGEQFIFDANDKAFIDLIQKPYFLEILIAHYKKTGTFSISRLGLMEEALARIYTENKQHIYTTVSLPDRSGIFATLEKIAFMMEVIGKNFLTDEEMHKVFPAKMEFDILVYLPGLKRYPEREMWMFEHNNLQEFLAARVLSRKSYKELEELVTMKTIQTSRIRPNWVNTLSFLLSMAKTKETKMLLDWIVENDIEIIIRFEADRVEDAQRTEIFKKIFNFYEEKQIWLASNKFSNKDLARFGQTKEVLEFLISRLTDKNITLISKLSAIMLVRNFAIKDFPEHKEELQKTLLSHLEQSGLEPHGIQTIMSALIDLDMTDRETVSAIVSRFRNNINQYVRAGLYKLLHHSKQLDENLSVFLDGLDLNGIESPIGQRNEVTLLDEDTHLREGLSKITGTPELVKLLNSIAENNKQYLFAHDYKELLEKIIGNCITAYKTDNSIYEGVYTLFRKAGFIYQKSFSGIFYNFFEKTDTLIHTFQEVWAGKETSDYLLSESLECLITPSLLEQVLNAYDDGEFDLVDMEKLHRLIDWNQSAYPDAGELLSKIEKAMFAKDNKIAERRARIDWETKNNKNYQDSFDLLFDPENLIRSIDKAYEIYGKTDLTKNDLSLAIINTGDKRLDIPRLIQELIRQFAFQDTAVNADKIKNWVQNDQRFKRYQIQEIYHYLTGNYGKYLNINESQVGMIQQWCSEPDSDRRMVWAFLNRFHFALPESKVLDLTFYYDSNIQVNLNKPGTIDKLEQFIDKKKLKHRVLQNLQNGIGNTLVFCSNAAYALNQYMIPAYSIIIEYLEKYQSYEYKFEELLTLWFNKRQDVLRLTEFVKNVFEDSLRWRAISLLQLSGRDAHFLRNYLRSIMLDHSQETDRRFKAVGYLFLMNDPEAFKFSAAHILENPEPHFDFQHNLHNLPTMTHLEMMPDLLKLLVIANKEEFKKNDFNNFESIILNTIYNIGIQSEENLDKVEKILLEFIKSMGEEGRNFNFIYFLFARMEEQQFLLKSKEYSINDALKEWV